MLYFLGRGRKMKSHFRSSHASLLYVGITGMQHHGWWLDQQSARILVFFRCPYSECWSFLLGPLMCTDGDSLHFSVCWACEVGWDGWCLWAHREAVFAAHFSTMLSCSFIGVLKMLQVWVLCQVSLIPLRIHLRIISQLTTLWVMKIFPVLFSGNTVPIFFPSCLPLASLSLSVMCVHIRGSEVLCLLSVSWSPCHNWKWVSIKGVLTSDTVRTWEPIFLCSAKLPWLRLHQTLRIPAFMMHPFCYVFSPLLLCLSFCLFMLWVRCFKISFDDSGFWVYCGYFLNCLLNLPLGN